MKIQILSDLHLEHFNSTTNIHEFLESLVTDCDVIALAGDITTTTDIEKHLHIIGEVFRGKDIFYIAGNHEFYHSSKLKVDFELRDESIKNGIHFLENNYYVMGEYVFIGACGWHDSYSKRRGTSSPYLNDFYLIDELNNDPLNACMWNRESYNYFYKTMGMFRDKKIICMTHNAPLPEFTPKQFEGDILNMFFVNDWSDLIQEFNPILWISGHLHNSKIFKKWNTEFVENSFGYYRNNQNPKFDKHLIIEV